MDPDAVRYPGHLYKVRGSLIMWTLHNQAQDAFLVWILAQDFARARNHGRPSGRVHKKHFLDQLIKDMGCIRITAQNRIKRSIKFGFIGEDVDNYYLITGRNNIVKTTIRKQRRNFEEKTSDFNLPIFFSDDRRYDVKAKNLVDPLNLNKTKALLYGIMAVYCSRQLLSRDTHAKILGNKRDAIIKLSKKAGIKEKGTYLLIDPISLLYQPDCTRVDAVIAFRKAEQIYRYGSERRVRGREVLQRRRVRENTYLVVQLPNTYTSTNIEKEVPIRYESFMALLGPGEGAGRSLTPDRAQKPRPMRHTTPASASGKCMDSYGGRKEQSPEGREEFLNSWELAGEISLPDSVTNRYLATLRDILETEECRDVILSATSAQNIRSISSISIRVWRSEVITFRNTPVETMVESRTANVSNPC